MKTTIRIAAAVAVATLALGATPSWADGGHGHGKHGWKHGYPVYTYGYRPYYREPIVVVGGPHYVYAAPQYVYPQPAYVYAPRRPALVIGVDIPPLVVPF